MDSGISDHFLLARDRRQPLSSGAASPHPRCAPAAGLGARVLARGAPPAAALERAAAHPLACLTLRHAPPQVCLPDWPWWNRNEIEWLEAAEEELDDVKKKKKKKDKHGGDKGKAKAK